MSRDDMNHEEQWEDIVRRLGGSEAEAKSEPVFEEPSDTNPADHQKPQSASATPGPRDYTLPDAADDEFLPPDPKPVATGSPRTLLSWFSVLSAVTLWVLAGMGGWNLPWWLTIVSTMAFTAGAISLFFLLPKTREHQDPFDDEDYGNGARV